MPIEVRIWRIASTDVTRVASSKLVDKSRLEDILENDMSILG